MNTPVTYRLDGPVATITVDDGKVNALSPRTLDALHAAFQRAEADGAVMVLEGRDGVFSAGFDLTTLRADGEDAMAMLRAGFDLGLRMLSFPRPLVVAYTGHAVTIGVFLLLCGDYRIGARGAFRITANEMAIGLPMPQTAIEICRQRLTPAALNRAVLLAETFGPDEAVPTGFLDRCIDPAELRSTAQRAAADLAGLDRNAHAASKLRLREPALAAIRQAIAADGASFGITRTDG